jgi:uncharacterized membrane protein HdeD (DUF308 family)
MLRQENLFGTSWPWWAQALRGVVLVIAGVLALMAPGSALVALAVAIGVGLLLAGILGCISALRMTRTAAPWGVMLAASIFEIVVGALILYRPLLSGAAIPLVVALWAMVAGISAFVGGMARNRVPLLNGTTAMATGAVLVLLGWLILANPAVGALTVVTLIGAALTVSGVASLAGAYAMYQRRNRPMPEQAQATVEEGAEPPRKAA